MSKGLASWPSMINLLVVYMIVFAKKAGQNNHYCGNSSGSIPILSLCTENTVNKRVNYSQSHSHFPLSLD